MRVNADAEALQGSLSIERHAILGKGEPKGSPFAFVGCVAYIALIERPL